jgi:hypothetical protein
MITINKRYDNVLNSSQLNPPNQLGLFQNSHKNYYDYPQIHSRSK